MSLLFIDSFDSYPDTDAQYLFLPPYGKWDFGDFNYDNSSYVSSNEASKLGALAGAGRFTNSKCLRIGCPGGLFGPIRWLHGPWKYIAPTQTVIAGFAFKKNQALTNVQICSFDSGATTQIEFWSNTNGFIEAWRGDRINGGVLLYSSQNWISNNNVSGYSVATDTWIFLEFKVSIDNSQGYIEVRADGTTILQLDQDVFTNPANTGYINKFVLAGDAGARIGDTGTYTWYDDFYLCSGDGDFNNDFLGDCRILTLKPNQAGTTTDFTPVGDFLNFNCVNEEYSDGNETYVTASAVGSIDLYNVESLWFNPLNIFGAQTTITAKKDNAGIRKIAPILADETGATVYVTPNTDTLSSSYRTFTKIFERNPVGSAGPTSEWVINDISTLQIGVKITE